MIYWPKNATTLVDMIDCHHGIICRLPSWQLGNRRFYGPWSCKNHCNFLLTLVTPPIDHDSTLLLQNLEKHEWFSLILWMQMLLSSNPKLREMCEYIEVWSWTFPQVNNISLSFYDIFASFPVRSNIMLIVRKNSFKF